MEESGRRKIRLDWVGVMCSGSGRSGGGRWRERRGTSGVYHVFQLCLSLPQRAPPCPSTSPILIASSTQSQKLSAPLCCSGWHFHRTYPSFPYFFYILFIFLLQVHPQLTLRSRAHSKAQSDSDRFLHIHTSLTCLICRLSVYRVLQLIPPDMDSTEGPVLPTEEWAEDQVLQSESGWIETAKRCLVSPLARHKIHLAFFSAVFCSPISFVKDR
jgi:hypothetical protein